MKKLMKKNFFLAIALFLLILYPLSAGAVPSLGVAPSSGGAYYGPYAEYLDYFADVFVTDWTGDAGFWVPPSGESLTVWYGADNGSPETDYNIYLATNSPSAGSSWNFASQEFELLQDTLGGYGDKAAAYKPLPYWGVNLGKPGTGDWQLLWNESNNESPPDGWPSGGKFWIYKGIITYTDFGLDDWFFAFKDSNNNWDVFTKSEEFSPRTTSSGNPVPEPATMLLLGSGLIGLGVFGRKKLFKRG